MDSGEEDSFIYCGGCVGEKTKFAGCSMKNNFHLQTLEHPDRIKYLAALEYPNRIRHLTRFSLDFYIRLKIYFQRHRGRERERLLRIITHDIE